MGIIPALMDLYFRYDDMANSYLYLAAGLELLGKWESIPAFLDLYFRYDDMANSYLYLAAGLELLVKWESFPPS